MQQFIALLRGINVGKNTLPIAELRALLTDLSHEQGQRYIQKYHLPNWDYLHQGMYSCTK